MSENAAKKTILVDAETAFEVFSLNTSKEAADYRQSADFWGIARTLKDIQQESNDKVDMIFIVQDKLNEGHIDVALFNMKENSLAAYFGNAQHIVSNIPEYRLKPEKYTRLLAALQVNKKDALFITNSVKCGDAAKQAGIGVVCNFSQCDDKKNPYENMLKTIKDFANVPS